MYSLSSKRFQALTRKQRVDHSPSKQYMRMVYEFLNGAKTFEKGWMTTFHQGMLVRGCHRVWIWWSIQGRYNATTLLTCLAWSSAHPAQKTILIVRDCHLLGLSLIKQMGSLAIKNESKVLSFLRLLWSLWITRYWFHYCYSFASPQRN